MLPIFVGACFIVAVVLLVAAMKSGHADFEKRFPPISDAEFLARCTPGTSPEVAFKVRRIVADHLAVEYERIYPSTSFIEDIGAE